MSVLRNITAIGALLAAAIIFFVVVCPVTPTPIAVVTANGKAPAPAVALLGATLLLLPFTLRLERSFAYVSQAESRHELPAADLLDLTCARLC